MKAHWQQEKAAIQKIRASKEQIEQAGFQIDEVTRKARRPGLGKLFVPAQDLPVPAPTARTSPERRGRVPLATAWHPRFA